MKQTISCLLFAICLIACNPKGIDFSYAPAAPKAGENVNFTNLTDDGEKWGWSFGDGTKSISRNPAKVYKKAGVYMVSLMVDSVKWKTVSKQITIYDTVPSFALSNDSVIYYMKEVTFDALVYNPFSYTLTYEWILPECAVITKGSIATQQMSCYFNEYGKEQTIGLKITLNGEEINLEKSFMIYDNPAPMLLYKQGNGSVWQQRVYDLGIENPHELPTTAGEAMAVINAAQDTSCLFNGMDFKVSTMSAVASISQPKGVDVDPIMRKLYVRGDNGLAICNVDFSNPVDLISEPVNFLRVDNAANKLFFSTADKVYSLKLIPTKNNVYPVDTVVVNNLTDVIAIEIY